MDLAEAAELVRCPSCGADGLALEIREAGASGGVRTGLMVCRVCGAWHRIEDDLVDLLPAVLKDPVRTRAFADRLGLNPPDVIADRDVAVQKEQIDFFRKDAPVYDAEVSDSTFYRLSDRMTFHRWIPRIPPHALVFDIASGTGRQSERIAAAGHDVFAVDLSEEMHRLAQRRLAARGLRGRTFHFLADAGELPFRSGVADAVICYGSMHHFPDHRGFLREVGRILKAGGLWYSLDPHRSPLRFLFDGVMRFWKLYDECAAPDPLFSAEKLVAICTEAGLDVKIRYHAFLLPHILNLLGDRWGAFALAVTDACFGRMPLVKRCAGLIISDGRKRSS